MSALILSPGWLALASAAGASLLAGTWLLGWRRYGARLAETRHRLARSEERVSTAALEVTRLKSLVDGLRAELREQKKALAASTAQTKASYEKEAWGQVEAMNDLFVEPRFLSRKVPDFEDTQIL